MMRTGVRALERKQILFVINTMGHGGAETAIIEMMKALLPTGCDIDLYVMTGQGELTDRLPQNVKLLNRHYDKSDVLSKQGKRRLYKNTFFKLMSRFSGLRNMSYIIRNYIIMKKNGSIYPEKLLWKPIADGTASMKKHYDTAVAYTEGAATYYVAKKVNADVKVAFFHTDYMMSGYTRELDNGCYDAYDRIFCVSDGCRDSFLTAYPEHAEKTDIMRNIIDVDGIRKKAREGRGFTDGYTGVRIISLGRLVKVKAMDRYVEALRILKERGIDVRWYCFGEGEERANLERAVAKYHLEDSFFLPGVTKDPYPYMYQSDICVQCSEFEGQGLAVREAQVLGLPLILFEQSGKNAGGIDGADCLFAKPTPESIADKAELLIKDRELRERLGENAAQKAQVFNDLQKFLDISEGKKK